MRDRRLMIHALAATAMTVFLASCGNSEQAVPPATPEAAQAREAVPADIPPATAAPEYEFYLLTREGKAVEDPRIVSTMEEHPCGPIDLVRVSSIPMDDPVFMPQYVVEFDAAGKEVNKWGVANEAKVIALHGQRLQFQVDDADRFWVTTDGALEKVADNSREDDIRTMDNMVDCPKLPTFAKSGAEQCFRVMDQDAKVRLIAVEPVCS